MKCHLLCQPVLLTLPQTKLSSRLLLVIRLICLLLPTLQQIQLVGATISQLDSHAISGDNNDTSSIWATDSTLWQIKPKPGYSISKREVEKSSEKASGNLNEFDPTLWTQSNQEHSSSHLHRHKRRRHRRRLPFGVIGKVIAKLTGRAKVAPAAAAADKMDDVLAVGGKLGKGGLGRGPSRGLPRRQQNRQVDPPSLNPYTLPRDEVARARSKALTGANLALATGGVAAGVWYFSGENSTLFAVLLGIALISLAVAVAVFCYCLLCRRRKRGYYAVNDDILMAFVKKLLFYMF